MRIERESRLIESTIEKRISVEDAARLLGVTPRTVWRKIARYRVRGSEGLIHGLTGKPSNRSKPAHLRNLVAECYRQRPSKMSLEDFNRKVLAGQGIAVCRETVRQWLIDAGMWKGRKGSGV